MCSNKNRNEQKESRKLHLGQATSLLSRFVFVWEEGRRRKEKNRLHRYQCDDVVIYLAAMVALHSELRRIISPSGIVVHFSDEDPDLRL